MDTELRLLQRKVENNPQDTEARERLEGVIARMGPLYGCEAGKEFLEGLGATFFLSEGPDMITVVLAPSRLISSKRLLQRASSSQKITMVGMSEKPVEHVAPNGFYFTVEDIIGALEKTERRTTSSDEWLNYADGSSHYLEGIHTADGLTWTTSWGS